MTGPDPSGFAPGEVPRVNGPLPGPLSRVELDAQNEVFYAGQTHGVHPFVTARKHGWLVEDLDGNVYVDLVSSSASVPFGAGRADLVEAATEQLLAFGNEDSHAITNPLMSRLARRLVEVTPASHEGNIVQTGCGIGKAP